MEKTKKMVLVPYKPNKPFKSNNEEDKEKNIQQSINQIDEHKVVNPLGEKLLSLDTLMENILKDNTLTDNQKMKEYSNAMQTYMEYKEKYSGPTQLVPAGTVAPLIEKTSPTAIEETILEKPIIALHELDKMTVGEGGDTDEHQKLPKGKKYKRPKIQYDFTKVWISL
jgi:hypothetical protein